MTRYRCLALAVLMLLGITVCPARSQAAVLTFDADDFGLTPVYSNVTTFSFRIEIDGPLTPGFVNPVVNSVTYNVFGNLETGTPSGFPAFNLQRTITGAEFIAQGSSLDFEVSATADLSDGLQISELVGNDPVFVFNGREVGTGRYHPALVQLNADGTGSIRNSNNFGGINPATNQMVDVNFGEEYITDLTFNPANLSIAIPEPSSVVLGIAVMGVITIRLRNKSRAQRSDP